MPSSSSSSSSSHAADAVAPATDATALTDANRAVFFFDIDNCLYPKTARVHEAMATLIDDYFKRHLSLSAADAEELHHRYYKDYGLAIEGLSRFHKIDPLDFNHEVDDALPLDDLLRPDPELKEMLEGFDRAKVKLWLFTNAHVTHGKRVVKLLEIERYFEGITYCDYGQAPLTPKPKAEAYAKAENEAGVTDSTRIYYVDDSHLNCMAAYQRGWQNTVHLVEPTTSQPTTQASRHQISHLRQLVDLFPELRKGGQNS